MFLDKDKSRFLSKFVKTDSCWNWKGALGAGDHRGYGVFAVGVRQNRKIMRPNRVAYMLFKGEVPKGMLVCHSCDNRACVNPDHLFLGTHEDNMADMVRKNRTHIQRNPKLAESQVREIRASSLSNKELAERFGVGKSSISMIRSKTTWKHIE